LNCFITAEGAEDAEMPRRIEFATLITNLSVAKRSHAEEME